MLHSIGDSSPTANSGTMGIFSEGDDSSVSGPADTGRPAFEQQKRPNLLQVQARAPEGAAVSQLLSLRLQ